MTSNNRCVPSEITAKAGKPTANRPEVERPRADRSRRSLLKSLTAAVAATVLPSALARTGAHARSGTAAKQGTSGSASPAKNPAWYGFNLLEYFSTDPDWMKYFPYKNDGMFLEDDFRWMRDWGFNFVRLPMDYRFWTDPNDLMKINEKKVEPIDRAIRLGEKYGVHVSLNLHRAPGLCVLDSMDEALTGIHVTKEKTSVYDDPRTLEAFVHQWTFFARRYRGTPNERLSFNLVNEPMVMPTAEEMKELAAKGETKPEDFFFNSELMRRGAEKYVRVARAAVSGIRAHDPQRWVITDGYPGAFSPIPDLIDTGMLQSCHTYYPMQVTHYQAEWARGMLSSDTPQPTWPLKDREGRVIDRAALAVTFRPWADLAQRGVAIHFGEMGCYKHTSPGVVLGWFNDTLDVIGELGSGWALWNFRGPFGILDTERSGTKYEDWRGHQLDRGLLEMLRKKIKS